MRNETNTYFKAKDIFENLGLLKSEVLLIPQEHHKIFRKHLYELYKRKLSDKRFSTTSLPKNKIEVIRIK